METSHCSSFSAEETCFRFRWVLTALLTCTHFSPVPGSQPWPAVSYSTPLSPRACRRQGRLPSRRLAFRASSLLIVLFLPHAVVHMCDFGFTFSYGYFSSYEQRKRKNCIYTGSSYCISWGRLRVSDLLTTWSKDPKSRIPHSAGLQRAFSCSVLSIPLLNLYFHPFVPLFSPLLAFSSPESV